MEGGATVISLKEGLGDGIVLLVVVSIGVVKDVAPVMVVLIGGVTGLSDWAAVVVASGRGTKVTVGVSGLTIVGSGIFVSL